MSRQDFSKYVAQGFLVLFVIIIAGTIIRLLVDYPLRTLLALSAIGAYVYYDHQQTKRKRQERINSSQDQQGG